MIEDDAVLSAITGRLSLRTPQHAALERLALAVSVYEPKKNADPVAALAILKTVFPDLEDFERDFPSICFELATGVGKTRLMGAFIAYLHEKKGLSDFFILAPGTTIYEKLLQDFSPGTSKYVFRGLGEFGVERPALITADNYERALSPVYGAAPIRINIFNIQKINSEVRGGRSPKIRTLSEYLGQSYFDMLARLDDLVLIMDESHRYRGSAGIRALNELKPVLGLEVTATPQVERGSKREAFRNVVYSYKLAQAMGDGFVKEPAAATRKDFDPSGMSEEAVEKIKLEDAVRLHEQVKTELAIYANRNGLPLVKPFILVVAQDTTHAEAIQAQVKTAAFCEGRYREKVITVHSNQDGDEKDETVRRLLQVESPTEPTEIVIHVNKLKEGWDVTNLYTIVPLRAARSRTLVEQTLGRGLRLPYGKRTGVAAIDTLTIVAHDHFDEIIQDAHKSGIFIRQHVIEGVAGAARQVQAVLSRLESTLGLGEPHRGIAGTEAEQQVQAEHRLVVETTLNVVRSLEPRLARSTDLQREEVRAEVSRLVNLRIALPQATIGSVASDREDAIRLVVDPVIDTIVEHTIDIPRVMMLPKGESRATYAPFELNVERLPKVQPLSDELWRQEMRTGLRTKLKALRGTATAGRIEDAIVAALIDCDDISYDEHADLLYGMAETVVADIRSRLKSEPEVESAVVCGVRDLAEAIHIQMKEHEIFHADQWEARISRGFVTFRSALETSPKDHDHVVNFKIAIDPRRDIRQYQFEGFSRSLYSSARFSSEPERAFAQLLEDPNDSDCLRWMRPQREHIEIYYDGSRRYEPDFIVETSDLKVLCEIKRADEIDDPVVQRKRAAATQWCCTATDHAARYGGKPWTYVLIPHNEIRANSSLIGLVARFRQN